MKSLRIFLYFLFFLAIVVFLGLHAFVSMVGRDLLTRKLRSVFQGEVSIGRVTTSFPLQLIVKDLEVKNWFKIRKVVASSGIIDIFGGNLVLPYLRLEGAEFELEKRKPGEEVQMPVNIGSVSENSNPGDLFMPRRIVLKHLVISEGVFHYIDYTKTDEAIRITVKDLNLKIDNFQWPFLNDAVTNFKISGLLPWHDSGDEGRIEFEGWVNLLKKDMRAKLEVKNIDGVYIYPYYSSWIDIDKARVDKARLNFTSNITSLNNDVNAACHLELAQISFKPKEEKEPQERLEKITQAVLGMLKAMDEGKVVLNFNLKTKLDNPEFGLGVIQKALEEKISRSRRESGTMKMIQLPGKILEGTFSSAAGLTKTVINGTVSVGQEIKRAVESSFTKGSDNAPVANATAVNTTE